ncbi:hypothetical protein CPT_Slocum_004 [Serratia phage Slocum]|nr:hypothetical protein CPT_Slocum_004 [Serratia phage Slocum]
MDKYYKLKVENFDLDDFDECPSATNEKHTIVCGMCDLIIDAANGNNRAMLARGEIDSEGSISLYNPDGNDFWWWHTSDLIECDKNGNEVNVSRLKNKGAK